MGRKHASVTSGSGDDVVQARDLTADSIGCGLGSDTAYVDGIDQDVSCERLP